MNKAERGAVLVEFALVALVVSVLLATSLEFGRLLFAAQVLQDAARVAARELAVLPVDARWSFDQALADPLVQQRIFDARKLVVDLDDPRYDTDSELDAYFASDEMPVVNRALRPLMFVDLATAVHPRLLRYPGALAVDLGAPSGFTVTIPQVAARDAAGAETVEWIPVVEEVRTDPCDPLTGVFSLDGAGAVRGMVAVRLNYPYQAGALVAYRPNAAGPFEPTIDNPIDAADDAVTEAPVLPSCVPRQRPGALLPDDPTAVGAYAGPFGLGRQYAYARTVRPFRRLLAAQALFRREVFE